MVLIRDIQANQTLISVYECLHAFIIHLKHLIDSMEKTFGLEKKYAKCTYARSTSYIYVMTLQNKDCYTQQEDNGAWETF